MIQANQYKYDSWKEKFPNQEKVGFVFSGIDPKWKAVIKEKIKNDKVDELRDVIRKTSAPVFPYPGLMFHAFRLTTWDDLKMVILGQDPYFNYHSVNGKAVPEAMGLSFSVPEGIKVPSSLQNIYKNLLRFGHIPQIPKHGNLESWARDGILLLNASLTVEHKKPNGHYRYWQAFTDDIIRYISDNKKGIVFVLWGSFALKKRDLIDEKKHKIIVSSHPSGLSYNKKLGSYPSFEDCDFFKEFSQKNNIAIK